MSKVKENIGNQLNHQKDKFEAMKKRKLERLHSPNKSNYNLKSYKLGNKSFVAKNKPANLVNNFPENSLNFEDKIFSQVSGETDLLKEISEFLEKNMNEMNTAIKDLKISFEYEINSLDGNLFIFHKYF